MNRVFVEPVMYRAVRSARYQFGSGRLKAIEVVLSCGHVIRQRPVIFARNKTNTFCCPECSNGGTRVQTATARSKSKRRAH